MSRAYYNENDPYAAQWLRNLISTNLIAQGDVDERSILDVRPDDLRGYTQCHFFAGIGGWSYALRLAGIPDDCPVWTGSPPCQPFSSAGKQRGKDDERHLWPVFFELIRECRPPILFGEQVENAIAHGWLDDLQDDLEGEGYACGEACLPACSVGAPHIRQRLFWSGVRLGDTTRNGRQQQWTSASVALQGHGSERTGQHAKSRQHGELSRRSEGLGCFGELANTGSHRRDQEWERSSSSRSDGVERDSLVVEAGGLGDSNNQGLEGHAWHGDDQTRRAQSDRRVAANAPDSFWRDADWLYCRDGRWRPVEPGTFPLADGLPSRVGELRAYGNAIVPQVAAEFVKAVML